jgi:hypothetical protein
MAIKMWTMSYIVVENTIYSTISMFSVIREEKTLCNPVMLLSVSGDDMQEDKWCYDEIL